MQDQQYQQIWDTIHEKVNSYGEANPAQTDAFFSRLHLQAFSEGFALLTADNAVIKSWVERQYSTLIKNALKDLYQTDFIVVIDIDEIGGRDSLESAPEAKPSVAPTNATQQAPVAAEPTPAPAPALETPNPEPQEAPPRPAPASPFSKMTFENYIIGESNRMAYAMALEVAEHPGRENLNPLFIYGKSGVGKTHLLVAIKNYLDSTSETGAGPLLKTVYVDSTEFVNDYADASADHSREKTSFKSFKERYEDADVLLIDDVQSFQGKKETLKIVFELFNKLTSKGKQVVMSADIAPKNIDIDERYQSRFNSGATFDIQAPEVETKLSIINSTVADQLQASNANLEVPSDVRLYIADISSSNIRELKSAVTVLLSHMMVTGSATIDVDQAARILENHFSNDLRRLTIPDIQREVEGFYKVAHADLVGKSRKHTVAYARQVAMYLSRQMMEETFESIGKAFGGKDHSTVKYSVDLVSQRVREDKSAKDEIDIIIAQIRNR